MGGLSIKETALSHSRTVTPTHTFTSGAAWYSLSLI